MANVRKSRAEVGCGEVDWAKVRATTEENIRRHAIEDGFDPDAPLTGFRLVVPPAAIRARIGMSQDAFARALHIPVATLRNWEQGRTPPDPAAQSLLALVNDDPEHAFKVLNSEKAA